MFFPPSSLNLHTFKTPSISFTICFLHLLLSRGITYRGLYIEKHMMCLLKMSPPDIINIYLKVMGKNCYPQETIPAVAKENFVLMAH